MPENELREKIDKSLEYISDSRINSSAYRDFLTAMLELSKLDGLFALKDYSHANGDLFLQTGIQMAIDGTEPETVKLILIKHKKKLIQDYEHNLDLILESIMMIQKNCDPNDINILFGKDEQDAQLFDEAWKIIKTDQKASASYLQRRMNISFNIAAKIIDRLEEQGYIGQQKGSNPREILKT